MSVFPPRFTSRLTAATIGLLLITGCTDTTSESEDSTADTIIDSAPNTVATPDTIEETAPDTTGETTGDTTGDAASDTAEGGQEVVAGSETYTIVDGDTLSDIASRAEVSVDDVVAVNDWSDGSDHLILPGDVIALPADASTPIAAATTTESSGDSASAPSCDEQSIVDATDTEAAIDSFACDGEFAGAGFIDDDGATEIAIYLAGDDGTWIEQGDVVTACEDNEIPGAVAVYCPGG